MYYDPLFPEERLQIVTWMRLGLEVEFFNFGTSALPRSMATPKVSDYPNGSALSDYFGKWHLNSRTNEPVTIDEILNDECNHLGFRLYTGVPR